MAIPDPTYPEYRLTVVWRADVEGNGIRCYLHKHEPEIELDPTTLMASFHPVLNILDAVERHLTEFFFREP